MSKVFVIGDTHFGHKGILNFKKKDGSPLRDFISLNNMHAVMIHKWNTVVGQNDLVLHLGDVAFDGKTYDTIMPLLNGRKYLIRGNHDKLSEKRYRDHFARVYGVYVKDNIAMTHVPIHPEQGSRWVGNVHGHMHGNKLADKFYFNASCENVDYMPMNFEDIKVMFPERM